MTPEQALLFLKQTLVVRQGLTVEDCAGLVTAWNVLAKVIEKEVKDVPGSEQSPST
jgi:hypothetical protein